MITLSQAWPRRLSFGDQGRPSRRFVSSYTGIHPCAPTWGWRGVRGVASSRAVRSLAFVFAAVSIALPAGTRAQTPPPPTPDPTTPPIVEPRSPSEPDEPAGDPVVEPVDITVRGLSWDVLAGGVPSSGGLLQGELGFSGLPRLAYHYTLMPGLSLGGLVAFDYARWAPDVAFTSSLVVAAVTRYSIYRTETWSIGLRGEPGLRIGVDSPSLYGILLNLQGHIGYTVEPRLIVGGGVDIPMEVVIPSRGGAFFSAPLLFGGFLEFHVTPPLALTADLKFGPNLNTTGTVFGMRVLAGMAVRL